MAVRNEEKYIADTLRSIQAQTHENFEALIFDNDSNDATAAICLDFCRTDSRFRLYRHRFNVGQVYNFSRCTNAATADYIAIRSGNDLLAPRYLEMTLGMLQRDPEMGLAYSQSCKIDPDGALMSSNYPLASYFETRCADPVAAAEAVMRCFIHPAPYFGLYRKQLLDRLQPLRHVFGGDKMFICEAALYAAIGCVAEPLSHERKHRRQNSLSTIFSEDAVFQVRGGSLFSRFEDLTPFADMIWGFTDMFCRAGIAEKAKGQLCQKAHGIFFEHYREQLDVERRGVLGMFENNRDQLLREKNHRIFNLARHNFLHRVMRMRFIFPRDDELENLTRELSELL